MSTAYLGLGSNIDASRNISSGIDELHERFDAVALSPVYRTKAVGFEGGDFINLVARVDTVMSPLALGNYLRELEDRHHRDRSAPRFSDRTLDVDILLYDDLHLLGPALELPREEILTAAHVLKPLADLAPALVHPVCHKTMAELWQAFPENHTTLKEITL